MREWKHTKMRLNLLILSALVVCAYAQVPNAPAASASTDSNQGTTNTAAPPSTAAPTTAAPTTAAPTTAAPTTAAPTTAGPTTPAPTTAAPTTAGPTTPAPTPLPAPKVMHFNVTNGTQTCLMMEVAMQFTVTYNTSKDEVVKVQYNLPENATAEGDCASDLAVLSQTVNVTWPGNHVTFEFERLTSTKEYGLKCIAFYFEFEAPDTTTLVGGDALSGKIDTDSEYVISQGGSYMCKAEKTINFSNVSITTGGPLIGPAVSTKISGFRYEAFHDISGGKYSTEEECSADFSTSDIVPIAVGCALAALVVIVLIAYLIGRRRSRQKGYQSV